jgi:hypothetical protein
LLRLALIRRDLDGISIIDAFLRCPDELDPAQDNFVEPPPPHWALWTMKERLRKRFGTIYRQAVLAVKSRTASEVRFRVASKELGSGGGGNSFFVSEFPEPYPIPKWPDEADLSGIRARENKCICIVRITGRVADEGRSTGYCTCGTKANYPGNAKPKEVLKV